ncbi:hypothetical protein TPHA_0C03200 [Tetrapisispora phaffii CBS 4417]|uniref:Uncharacterized protein n=1 Tax=Tetrapisispora phaffii (strain ATCC 24235 / CBS 4417 / NBRC 1672 / NRRL Y-8282 / UCD 70-5) TaxID=1071381 RepID=G8BRU7_TETPH|nr:hypothetical protein TPHA_0C03200 [Tetrapisispora phaffii CBS 4417]CCE62473.1 hypothetical protein TPHA_0C03200 [Tetrapisispora phaffii CBS 4417]
MTMIFWLTQRPIEEVNVHNPQNHTVLGLSQDLAVFAILKNNPAQSNTRHTIIQLYNIINTTTVSYWCKKRSCVHNERCILTSNSNTSYCVISCLLLTSFNSSRERNLIRFLNPILFEIGFLDFNRVIGWISLLCSLLYLFCCFAVLYFQQSKVSLLSFWG